MAKSRISTRKTLATFYHALVAHGLSAQLVYYRQFIVWQDRSSKWNTASIGPYGHYAKPPDLLRLYVNVYVVQAYGQRWRPEGPRSEITFLPGEEGLLADPLARILSGPDP